LRFAKRLLNDLPLLLSIKVALASTALSILGGAPVAWLLAKRTFPGRFLLEGITILPLVLPPTVLGYYLLVVLAPVSTIGRFFHRLTGSELTLTFNLPGIILAACLASFPLFLRQAQIAFAEIDSELENSARLAGASEFQVFRYITVPLARNGLVAGSALTFARSLGDFGATLMVGGNIPGVTRTLSLKVYDAWQSGEDSVALGLSFILAGMALAGSVLAARLTRRD